MKLQDALLWYDDNTTNEEEKICLITKQPIQHEIILKCNHCFEYDALLKYYIKTISPYLTHCCPYCRMKHDGFIPLYESCDFINTIYEPDRKRYFKNNSYITCDYCLKSGKNKGVICGKVGHKYSKGNYCTRHHNLILKSNTKNALPVVSCCKILKSGCQCKNKMFDEETGFCKRHLNLNNKLNNSS